MECDFVNSPSTSSPENIDVVAAASAAGSLAYRDSLYNVRFYEVTQSAMLKLMNESNVLRAIEPEASASSPPI
jgi:hypothetical protein